MKHKKLFAVAAAAACLWSSPAFAWRWCTGTIKQVIHYDNTVRVMISYSGGNYEKVIGSWSSSDQLNNAGVEARERAVTAAMLAGKTVSLRYDNGYTCEANDTSTAPRFVVVYQ